MFPSATENLYNKLKKRYLFSARPAGLPHTLGTLIEDAAVAGIALQEEDRSTEILERTTAKSSSYRARAFRQRATRS